MLKLSPFGVIFGCGIHKKENTEGRKGNKMNEARGDGGNRKRKHFFFLRQVQRFRCMMGANRVKAGT